jgi:hypothetical protein
MSLAGKLIKNFSEILSNNQNFYKH